MAASTYYDRSEPLAILELADEYTEDEYGNTIHIFETPVAKVVLERCWYDGDTSISVIVPTQDVPIVKIELVACDEIRAIDDKRGKYFEFVGQRKVEEFNRGSNRKTIGFRVYLMPFVSVEPFLCIEPV